MKDVFKKGDTQKHDFVVKLTDYADFRVQTVHKVCSTFALAREIEWSTRLFVLEMLEAHEEGIGTALEIKHESPAFLNENVEIIATFKEIKDWQIICSFSAQVKNRLIATGKTKQMILTKSKIEKIFNKHNRL